MIQAFIHILRIYEKLPSSFQHKSTAQVILASIIPERLALLSVAFITRRCEGQGARLGKASASPCLLSSTLPLLSPAAPPAHTCVVGAPCARGGMETFWVEQQLREHAGAAEEVQAKGLAWEGWNHVRPGVKIQRHPAVPCYTSLHIAPATAAASPEQKCRELKLFPNK